MFSDKRNSREVERLADVTPPLLQSRGQVLVNLVTEAGTAAARLPVNLVPLRVRRGQRPGRPLTSNI